ncbi:hypothetical protein FRB99_004528 [Tulasnella sp. 403]|nr:hypothetical protein FRB99_004528 [Tulasnella sp. 403]
MSSSRPHYRLSFGEHLGQLSYIVQSAKGLESHNIPPSLQQVLRRISVSNVIDFALGPAGYYFLKYREPKDGSIAYTAPESVWKLVRQLPSHRVERVVFGAKGQYWTTSVDSKGRRIITCNVSGSASEASFQALSCPSGGPSSVGFVAMGPPGTFVFSSTTNVDEPYTMEGLSYDLWRTISVAAMKKVKIDKDIWCIIFDNGKVKCRLPSEHEPAIMAHFNLSLSLRNLPSHARDTETITPPTPPPSQVSTHQSRPLRRLALSTTPLLVTNARHVPLSPASEAQFTEVSKLFQKAWRNPFRDQHVVQHVYLVHMDARIMAPYQSYRKKQPAANEHRLFHGTRRYCTIGDNETSLNLCDEKHCSVCMILRSSYKVEKAGTRPESKRLRWGRGIYTSTASSKAHDYCFNKGGAAKSKCRAVFLNSVILGQPMQLQDEDHKLQKPPESYNSVIGRKNPELDYEDAYVVYNNDAIRPTHLVVYRRA